MEALFIIFIVIQYMKSVPYRSDAYSQHSNATHFPNGTYECVKTMPWDCLTSNTSAYIYIGLVSGMFLCGLIRCWSLYAVGVRSSKTLHDRLYQAVVRAPIRFHDTNSKGSDLLQLCCFDVFMGCLHDDN